MSTRWRLALLALLAGLAWPAAGQQRVLVKMATLVPDGSSWHQILKEAAAAAKRGGCVVVGIEVDDLLHALAIDADDIACRIEPHPDHDLVRCLGPRECVLLRVHRHVIPVLLAELADESGPTQRLFDRNAIVDARLHRIEQCGVRKIAAMIADRSTAASRRENPRRCRHQCHSTKTAHCHAPQKNRQQGKPLPAPRLPVYRREALGRPACYRNGVGAGLLNCR